MAHLFVRRWAVPTPPTNTRAATDHQSREQAIAAGAAVEEVHTGAAEEPVIAGPAVQTPHVGLDVNTWYWVFAVFDGEAGKVVRLDGPFDFEAGRLVLRLPPGTPGAAEDQ